MRDGWRCRDRQQSEGGDAQWKREKERLEGELARLRRGAESSREVEAARESARSRDALRLGEAERYSILT